MAEGPAVPNAASLNGLTPARSEPAGQPEPLKYWLLALPADAPLTGLVRLAKHRWIIERDYQELKQELGLGRVWVPDSRAEPLFPLRAGRACCSTNARTSFGLLSPRLAAFGPSGIIHVRSPRFASPPQAACSGSFPAAFFRRVLFYNRVELDQQEQAQCRSLRAQVTERLGAPRRPVHHTHARGGAGCGGAGGVGHWRDRGGPRGNQGMVICSNKAG